MKKFNSPEDFADSANEIHKMIDNFDSLLKETARKPLSKEDRYAFMAALCSDCPGPFGECEYYPYATRYFGPSSCCSDLRPPAPYIKIKTC